MKYPLIQLIKAYFTELNGVISTPVYDGIIPNSAPSEYVLIGDRLVVNIGQDGNLFTECMVTFDVTTKTRDYGFKGNSSVVDEILAIINDDTVLGGMANFEMDNQVIEDIQPLPALTDKENLYRTIIRVRAYLTQK